ncbi:MAG: enoyl-CoA hydratase [Gammaproteobacteria bacterium]|nr:enoyl-CoA hydratase [Gammaproteobacteria bacterium]
MDYRHIAVERRNAVGVIRLNRPHVRNAQSRVLLEEMNHAFAAAELDDEIRVVVLSGAGEHFSAGHDLGTPEELEDQSQRGFGAGYYGRINRSWNLFVESSLRWRDIKKPTIAQVQGYCIFGGFLIASCMDCIIAADDAKFLPSHLQLFTAPWDLGIRKSKQILFENRFIGAREALDLGLVSEVVPRASLDDAVMAQAARWAENDLLTLRMLKQSINQAQDAMGFRNSIEAAHSSYMLLELSRLAGEADGTPRERVAKALAKFKQSDAKQN